MYSLPDPFENVHNGLVASMADVDLSAISLFEKLQSIEEFGSQTGDPSKLRLLMYPYS